MTARRYAALALVLATLWITPAAAFHTVFQYRVDRFEADGNLLGPFDGTPDVVDEFDAPPLSPLWYQAYGTVSESGGYLVLQSPGVHFPSPDETMALDTSVAGGTSILSDGNGDFTGTAYWEGVIPAVDQHYYMALFTYVGPLAQYAEIFGVAIRNIAGTVAIEQLYTELNRDTSDYQNTQEWFHDIDAGDVTGRIVFRIAFDDASNLATTSFSLDNGTTWQNPFPGHLVFQGRYQAQFLLGGDPPADPNFPTTTTTSSTTSTTLAQPIDFGPWVPLSENASDFSPSIATDRGGHWSIAWNRGDDILVARSTDDGASWSNASRLSHVRTGNYGTDIAMDAAGRGMIVWSSTDGLGNGGTDSDILAALTTTAGANWSAPVRVNTNGGADTDADGDYDAHIATDGAGTWLVVWTSNSSLYGGVLVARSTDGGASWTDPVVVSNNGYSPRIAFDGIGAWALVYSTYDTYRERDIVAVRSTDGGDTWSAPVAVPGDAASDSGDDVLPTLTASAGTLVATWLRDYSYPYSATSTTGGSSWTDQRITGFFVSVSGDIATDGMGTWVSVWPNRVLQSIDAGATWVPVPAPISEHLAPKLAADGAGHWVLVAEDSHPGSHGIAVTRGGLCGDSIVAGPEECDDGNRTDGDCCSAACLAEPGVCDDNNACTTNDACVAGTCAGTSLPCPLCEMPDPGQGCACAFGPRPACHDPATPAASSLKLTNATPDSGDKLSWVWAKGKATAPVEFGSPAASDDYALCIYDGASATRLNVPAAGTCGIAPCWRTLPSGGFKYVDAERTPDGIARLTLKPGSDGKAKATVKGSGDNLPMPSLPLALPATVQLQTTNGQCWAATYSTGVVTNDESRFVGKSD